MKSIMRKMAQNQAMAGIIFSSLLLGLHLLFRLVAKRYDCIKNHLQQKNLTVLIKRRGNTRGRCFTVRHGQVTRRSGIFKNPDIAIAFENALVALDMMVPPQDSLCYSME